jgi:hypothetical protein
MRKLMVAAIAALAAGMSQAAELEVSQCRFPEAPQIPDGVSATEADMAQAGSDVREFVSAIQSSLQCLSTAEESMGEEISEDQQAQLVAIYNNGVDQMNTIAENYNEQVRAFKGR